MTLKEQLKEKLVISLEDVLETTENITTQSSKVPQLEIDRLKDKIRLLYDAVIAFEQYNSKENPEIIGLKERLKTTKEKYQQEQEVQHTEPIIQKEIIKPIEQKPTIKKELTPIPEQQSIIEEKSEEVLEEKTETTKPTQIKQAVKEKLTAKPEEIEAKDTITSKKTNVKAPLTIADKLKDEKPLIHDKVASTNTDKSIGAKLSKKPIADIKKAIGINERYLMINELFGGNNQAFNQCIDSLNNANNKEEAEALFEKHLQEKGWNMELDAVIVLYDLVQRRFMEH